MIEVALTRVTDFAALGERWRALEAGADCSFFQSWTWMGCLVEERFPDPVLAEARSDGQTVALALFNRRRGLRDALHLGETGDAERDSPYIEYNGVLEGAGAEPGLAAACLEAAIRQPIKGDGRRRRRWLRLSGVTEATLAAARAAGPVALQRKLLAPWVDLAALAAKGQDYLTSRSANTRYQLRRSERAYAAHGELSLARATSAAEAHGFLAELEGLHQAAWTARGHRGAFAPAFFGRFHHALIDRGMDRGEIDLLRVAAGPRLVGLLYNLRFRGRMLAYQGGFDYAGAGRHEKPGLTCHLAAIRFAMANGLECYDFLAGEERYKRSLADGETALFWLTAGAGGVTGWGDRVIRQVRRAVVVARTKSANFTASVGASQRRSPRS